MLSTLPPTVETVNVATQALPSKYFLIGQSVRPTVGPKDVM